MVYDLGVSELLMDEAIDRLDAVVPLSLGVDDVRVAVLEACRYLYPTALVCVSDAHGRMSVLCSQD
eukprot:1212434-Alexandrium_andersonii.AAC.1